MKRFIKTIIAPEEYTEVQKIGDVYVVHLDGTQVDDSIECYECIVDKEPDMDTLSAELQEWKNYIAERELASAKFKKIEELKKYDSSTAVNSFSVNGKDIWLDAQTRQQLRISLDAMKDAGRDSATKWFDGVMYEYPMDMWYAMLGAVEVYASDALNVTEQHKAAINSLSSVEEVEAYDFTVGYPEKLIF